MILTVIFILWICSTGCLASYSYVCADDLCQCILGTNGIIAICDDLDGLVKDSFTAEERSLMTMISGYCGTVGRFRPVIPHVRTVCLDVPLSSTMKIQLRTSTPSVSLAPPRMLTIVSSGSNDKLDITSVGLVTFLVLVICTSVIVFAVLWIRVSNIFFTLKNLFFTFKIY